MADLVHSAQHEFWRPPASVEHVTSIPSTGPAAVEVCSGCGAEFMVAARFCHVCGSTRSVPQADEGWTRYLELQNIMRWIGLPIASFVAFLLGVACLLCALATGLVYSIQTFVDFQAVQLYRVQWLLAAIAAFIAGMLLKRKPSQS